MAYDFTGGFNQSQVTDKEQKKKTGRYDFTGGYVPEQQKAKSTDMEKEIQDLAKSLSVEVSPERQINPAPEREFFTPEGGMIPALDLKSLWLPGEGEKVAHQALKIPYNLGFRGTPETESFIPKVEPPKFTREEMRAYQESMKPISPLGKIAGFGAEQAAMLPFYLAAELGLGAPLASAAGKGLQTLSRVAPKAAPAIEKVVPYAKTFASGFGTGLPVGTMEGLGAGERLPEALKGGVASGLTFGTFNVAAKGVGSALKALRKPKTATAAEKVIEESRDFAEGPRLSAKKLALAETEQKALDRLNKGIEDVQNFLQHKDIYAVYPPGTTIEAALVDIKAKTGVDLLKLVADVEAAQARGGLRQQIAGEAKFSRLGQAAGAIPQPSKLTGISQERTIGRLPKLTPLAVGKAVPEEKLLGKGSISAAKLRIPGKMEPVGEGQKVRSLGVSAMRNPETPSEVRAGLLMETYPGESGVYTAITNKATIDEAKKMISSSVKQAERFAKNNPGTALSNTINLELVKKANLEGRFDDAIDLIQEVSGRSTTQGQAIQSLRLWGKMTPEGMQKFYVDTIDKVNKDIANAAKKVKLSDNIMAKIKGNMDEIAKMPEGRDKLVKVAQTLDTIASQVPVDFWRKVASLHTMAQLLNPKTAIRNIGGNIGFAGLENISDVVGAVVDRPLSLITGKRTKVLPSLTAQLRGGKQGWKLGLEDALLGIDTSGMATKFDLPIGRTFRTGPLGFAEKALNIELRATDRAFYQAAFEGSLQNQMRAAKVSVPTEEMRNIAHLDGLYRTFQDESGLSKLFVGIKRALNKLTGNKEFGIGDFIIKYPRTPANLLARGLDYSPAGVVRVILEAARPLAGKQFNQKAFVEAFSRSMVGSTALFGTGALLHRLGIITGRPPEDRDLAELQRQQGFGEYRINISALKRLVFGSGDTKPQKGDKIVSYDWFQPQAISVAIGADVDANKGTGKGIAGTLMDALIAGINAFAEQPVVQGLQTLFSGGYGDWSKGVVKVLETIPSSFVPTLLSQIRQLVDNQRRETYSPEKGREALNRVMAKVPGLASLLPRKYGTLGQPLETYPGGGNMPFNVFLNPAFVNTYAPSKEVQRVFDLYSQIGETKQVPRVADKSITVSGKKFVLTGPEYSEYQRLLGEYTQQGFAKMPTNLKPEDAVKRMQEIMTDANTKARMEILKARGENVYKKGSGIAVK